MLHSVEVQLKREGVTADHRCPHRCNPSRAQSDGSVVDAEPHGQRARLVISVMIWLCATQGTFYGNNGWAGACAGLVPQTGQPWPPPGGSYQNSMQPGSSTPINVAINSRQWSVPMVRGITLGGLSGARAVLLLSVATSPCVSIVRCNAAP